MQRLQVVLHIGNKVRKAGRVLNYIFIAFLGRKCHGGPAAVTGPGRVPFRVPLIIKGHLKVIGNLKAPQARPSTCSALVGSEFNGEKRNKCRRNSPGALRTPGAFASEDPNPHAISSSCSLHVTRVCELAGQVRSGQVQVYYSAEV